MINFYVSFESAKKYFTGDIALTMVAGAGGKCLYTIYKSEGNEIKEADRSTTRSFNKGSHLVTLSMPSDIEKRNCQFESRPGYKAYGLYDYYLRDDLYDPAHICRANIVFINEETVKCTSNQIDRNNKYIFSDFGECQSSKNRTNADEFGILEHIISVPTSKAETIAKHEGYEVLGTIYTEDTAITLYDNVVPVTCKKDEYGYTTFGIPIEKNKEKSLKN